MLDDYETLSSAQNENDIKLTQNYYTYILLVILSITVVILLYVIFGSKNTVQQNIQTGGDLNKNSYFVILVLIIFIVAINFFFRKQSL
jgi:NADH:ubiquinone oxidoreductase subunit 3 (subunit A)